MSCLKWIQPPESRLLPRAVAAILAGEIDLDELENLDDEAARASLLGIKGVGP